MTFIAIGGAEKREGDDMTVLKAVLDEAKGSQSRVHVITTASDYPADMKQIYEDAFHALGVTELVVSHVTKEQASDPALLAQIGAADVVFFSGGDQSRLVEAIGGTPLHDAIRARHEAGAVVAGTSAGAAAMSLSMIAGGDPAEAHKPEAIPMESGFGFMPEAIFDTHFSERGRLPRLFNTVSRHPAKTGIGLDENTGAIVRNNGEIEVIGSGNVVVVTGASGADATDSFGGKGFAVRKFTTGEKFKLK